MGVLAVQEYQRIQCGDAFDAATRTITATQHRLLERTCEEYKRRFGVSPFDHGPRSSFVAKNFVGVVCLGRDQIEVLPKIESETTQVRKNLSRMIATALSMDLHAAGTGQMDKTDDSVLEILVRLFCRHMWNMVRRGLVRKYLGRSENLSVLRGRLSVASQIRMNLSRPDRLACDFDEFGENNLINQVLKAALRVLLPVARSSGNQRNLAELLFCFQEVDDLPPAGIPWHLLGTDRLTRHLEPHLNLARVFIEGRSQDVLSGASSGFTLLFDMNELFEAYVGAVARKVFSTASVKVSLQGPHRHLAQRPDGVGAFQLRPDIVVSDGGQVRFIADTKWKRLKPADFRDGVVSADVYQMYAYSSKYAAPEVVLLYPHHAELGEWRARRAEYWLGDGALPAASGRRIGVATIDLRDLATVPKQLAQAFPNPQTAVGG
jgi:5-methylcytosine-specific restriction enzyme subunit McrC